MRIILVDDDSSYRALLRAWIERRTSFQVVAEASDGVEAVALAETFKPDVVVMDFNMPVMDGAAATRQIKEMVPTTIVVGHSAASASMADQAMREAGAEDFIPKDDRDELVSWLQSHFH